MRLRKLIITVVFKMVWLGIWLLVSDFAFLVCQSPDPTYILDSNYQLWNWPGTLIRLKPADWEDDPIAIRYVNPLDVRRDIKAFAVLEKFIVGRTSDGWFAINKETHEIWYPHKSQEALRVASGVTFYDPQLTTSRPWSRMVIHLHTKVALPLIALLFSVPLIGFRRTGRILKFPFKWVHGLIKKPTVV